jgi:NCAIR mutase (PurE)-related protein
MIMIDSGDAGSSLEAFAQLDHERTKRRGYPEAIYCKEKTPEQFGMIAAALRDQPYVTLFTRASKEHAAAILSRAARAFHDQTRTCSPGRREFPTLLEVWW